MNSHPWFDHPGPIPIAHRGGAGDEPENTMRAFRWSWSLGYRHLETDVHATADGVLVAFHDASLDRVTDRQGLIRELSWNEVSRARVAGVEPIPRLSDLLEELPEARLSIDPKHDSAVEPLCRVLSDHRALDRVVLGAFSGRRLDRLRARLGPDAAIGLGPGGLARLAARARGLPLSVPAAECVQPPLRQRGLRVTSRRLVEEAHRHGMAVLVWTVDEADDMHRVLDDGADGIITDRPLVLRRVLDERGQWVD